MMMMMMVMQAKLLQEHSVTLVGPNVAYLCPLTLCQIESWLPDCGLFIREVFFHQSQFPVILPLIGHCLLYECLYDGRHLPGRGNT